MVNFLIGLGALLWIVIQLEARYGTKKALMIVFGLPLALIVGAALLLHLNAG